MPIIAVEEDCDEVSRLLSNVPDVESFANLSINCNDEQGKGCRGEHGDNICNLHNIASLSDQYSAPQGDVNPSSTHHQEQNAKTRVRRGSVTKDECIDENDNANDGIESLGSTFELCSISSYADPLSLSISKSKRSIDVSIGKSNSSRNRYVILRKNSSSQLQLNKSIGSTNSSNRKVGCSNINLSIHSTASKLAEVIVRPKTDSIDTKYFIDYSREIGRGTKTIVRKCVERSTGNRYAVKSVRRADVNEYENMRKEANLLTALNHLSIIQIYDTYEDDKYLHMVVEICKGGELYDHIVKPSKTKKKKRDELNCPSEEVAAIIVRRVVDAVAYLHNHNIVHRDLKLENLLFKMKPNTKNKQSLTDVRIIDFGLSRRYNTHHRFVSLQKLTSFVGTKFYVAPEVLNHSYTHAVDVWSIGVLAYALLSAKAPFTGRNDQELFDNIQSCGEELKFPSPDFDNVSEMAKNFIRHLLIKEEAHRPTACEVLGHPWMLQATKWKDKIDSGVSVDRKSSKPSIFRNFFDRCSKSNNGKKTKACSNNDLDSATHNTCGDHSR